LPFGGQNPVKLQYDEKFQATNLKFDAQVVYGLQDHGIQRILAAAIWVS